MGSCTYKFTNNDEVKMTAFEEIIGFYKQGVFVYTTYEIMLIMW